MKTILTILTLFVGMNTNTSAAAKTQEAAEILAVVAVAGKLFSPEQKAALEAAASKLNGEGDLTEEQKVVVRGVLAEARKNETIAPVGKAKEDVRKFISALEKALGTTTISTSAIPAPKAGTLTTPVKAVWEGEDPAAPKINAGHGDFLVFSAKITGSEVGLAGEDATLYKTAAENAAKFLKGEATSLSDLDAVVLQECGQIIRLSGFGSMTKQKLNKKQLLAAINAALQKGGYELVEGTTAAVAQQATTPVIPAPAVATATPPQPPVTGGSSSPGAGPGGSSPGLVVPDEKSATKKKLPPPPKRKVTLEGVK